MQTAENPAPQPRSAFAAQRAKREQQRQQRQQRLGGERLAADARHRDSRGEQVVQRLSNLEREHEGAGHGARAVPARRESDPGRLRGVLAAKY